MVRHLYLHIPFCHRICPYCSFYKHQHGATDLRAFVDAMVTEAEQKSALLAPLTVYLGGGTPTALSETHLERLLAGLRGALDLTGVIEYTVEANPRTVTPSKAEMLMKQGVTRVSLGVQAWDEETLRTLGRDHAAAEAEETYRILRGAGFESVNIDLMFSIPGQTAESWRETVERTLALGPDHVSAYNLNYEEDTEFFQRLRSGRYRESEDRDAAFFYLALDLLESAGFEHYEISNYARLGKGSVHNEAYWLGKEYVGLGPSAYSTVGGRRWQNVADTTRYIELAGAGASPALPGEDLTGEQRRVERFGLELRTARGLPVELISLESAGMLETLRREGLLTVEQERVRLTRAGKPLVDSVAVALLG